MWDVMLSIIETLGGLGGVDDWLREQALDSLHLRCWSQSDDRYLFTFTLVDEYLRVNVWWKVDGVNRVERKMFELSDPGFLEKLREWRLARFPSS